MSSAAEVQRTAAVDLGALLDAGEGAVVTLVAGETRLAAHRAVLEERSPVFRAVFQHDTLEASCGEVRMADVGGPVLRQLLSYMYTLQAPQLTDTARELLAAADRYGLSALKAACEQQVAAQLEVETAAAAAVLAVRHSCPSLTADAVHFIRSQTHKVMATQGWADAVLEYPKDIVEVSRLLGEPPASAGRGCSSPSTATRRPRTLSCRGCPPHSAATRRRGRLSPAEPLSTGEREEADTGGQAGRGEAAVRVAGGGGGHGAEGGLERGQPDRPALGSREGSRGGGQLPRRRRREGRRHEHMGGVYAPALGCNEWPRWCGAAAGRRLC
ncbi:protein roadkill-like isoform X2 [Schistocerca nitens]|uniref:protein roadkill-like isoform X2 n=1 Tax=Schistocerca nitens TaxID=7011 RepID=UPI0021178520|nr:protein roadkill-like isoform X2 [Schistocerca nitens]XP_049797341.1 protein roadkill-like isoform X2 [Schistocerca nitens]